MKRAKQILSVTAYNFRQWHKNPRIIITFCLAFVLCFLLSDKAVQFAKEYETTMQIVEAFVWTFGDANSILLSSLLLLLLFADMPFISSGTPFYLMRIDRKTWIAGQAVYIIAATAIYLTFILVATSLVCMTQSFTGNMWSETAAILGYSGAGQAVALPALVKTLEMSTPYACMFTIFLLMLLYTLLMVFIMLLMNLKKGQTLDRVYVGEDIEEPGVSESKWPELRAFYQDIGLRISYEKIPVISLLFSTAFHFWLVLACLFGAVVAKARQLYLPLLILVAYTLISMAVPIMLLRYFAALLLAFPIVLVLLLQPNLGKEE